jgi:hypothetical protein
MAEGQRPIDQKPPDAQLTPEQYRELYYLNREDAKRAMENHRSFVETTNKAAIESANLALRMAILINGGASVALLAFVGGMVSQGRIAIGPQLSTLASTLIWFASGVAVATLATGFAYFTNLTIIKGATTQSLSWEHPYIAENSTSKRWGRLAEGLRWMAAILAFGSVGLFACGMIQVYFAVARLASP